ncbi:MAG TPA: PqqD family protein [Candidatus Polarisedimenticolaceae bacterium]|nr:PqqD family protein [Candidatus Polarisedimenticolaceae bacterium]
MALLHGSDRARPKPGVLCKILGSQAVLLELESETYFGLNETGTRLWALLMTAPSIREAVDTMLSEYDVAPAELERDAAALIDELIDRGLLRVERA